MPGNNEQNYIIKIVLDEQAITDSLQKVKDEVKGLNDTAKKAGNEVKDGLGDGFKKAADESKKSQSAFGKIFSGIKDGIARLIPSFKSLEKAAGDSAKPMSMGMAAVLGGIGGAAGAAAIKGVGMAFGFLKDNIAGVIEESIKDESALNRLNTALANTGKYSDKTSAELKALSDEMEDVSLHGGDEILNAMAKIQGMGNLSVSQLGKATQAAIDLAAGTGMAFDAAAGVIAKAANGNVSSLGKMGIAVDTTKTKAGQFEDALDKINKKFAGAGMAQTLDFSGTVKKLNDQIGGFQSIIGDLITQNPAVLATLSTLGDIFRSLTGTVEKNKTGLQDFVTNTISGLVKGISTASHVIIDLVAQFQPLISVYKAISLAHRTLMDGILTYGKALISSEKMDTKKINEELKQRAKDRFQDVVDSFKNIDERKAQVLTYHDTVTKAEEQFNNNLIKQKEKTNTALKTINANAQADALKAQEETKIIATEDETEFLNWKKSAYDAHFAALREAYGDDYAVWFDKQLQKVEATQDFTEAIIQIKQSERDLEKSNLLSFTKWERLNWKQRLSNTTDTLSSLSALQNSQTMEMFRIGQAAAAANAAISTAQGAIAAYTSLAGIPVVGPALGAAAAAALIVFGVEQQKQIWSQQPPIAKAHNGGLVGGNVPYGGDMGMVRVERLERIITPEQNSGFEKLVFGSDNLLSTLSKMNAFLEGNSPALAGSGNIYMDGVKLDDSLQKIQERKLQ